VADLKLEMQIDDFERRLREVEKLTDEEVAKTVKAGAASFAIVAARYTPPGVGSQSIPDQFYQDGLIWNGVDKITPGGRRLIVDLLVCARSSSRWSSWAGHLLREGFYYFVTSGKHKSLKSRKFRHPCRTLEEAHRYAHLSNRGLLRAAWGLSFQSIGMRMPNGFSSLIAKRPALSGLANLSSATMTKESVELFNNVREAGGSFTGNMEAKAYFQALKTMNQRMDKFFNKKMEA